MDERAPSAKRQQMPRPQPYAVGMGSGLVHLLGAPGIATPCKCGGATTADASPGIPALPISLVARQEACHDELSSLGLGLDLAATRQEACHDELSALGLGLDLAATSVRAGPTPLLGVVGRCRHMEATG